MRSFITTVFWVLGILAGLPGRDSCKFGDNCDYPCHCQDNDVCDSLDGSCLTGCNDGELGAPEDYWYTGAWSGYGCQIGNVAYGKTATQGPRTFLNHNAVNAIDGSHEPRLGHGRCAYANGGISANPAWWQVNLGDNYVVISVNLTNRNQQQQRMNYIDITIGNGVDPPSFQRCTRINGEGEADTVHVFCDFPRIGHVVRLQKLENADSKDQMTLCEVQVYGYRFYDCPDDYFGVACGTPCNCRGQCAHINGECSTQNCIEGWTGSNCQTACQAGTWGDNCQGRCNCADGQEVCNHVNGSCRCPIGYGGASCNLELPGLHSTVELSSASLNTLTIRFHTWTSQNDEGSEPQGYHVEIRLSDGGSWVSGSEIDHNRTITIYTVLLKNLEQRTYYYVRVSPFIEDMGLTYYGTPTQIAGPFLTMDTVVAEDSSTSNISTIVGAIMGCIAVAILVVVVAIVLRRYRLQKGRNNNELVPTNVVITESNGIVETGSNSHVTTGKKVESRSELTKKGKSLPPLVSDDHIYGNQDPIGRAVPVGDLESYIEEMSKRKGGFTDEFSEISVGVTAVSDVGNKSENRKLNRFKDISAYDHSRVVLKALPGGNSTGFINANYIHKYKDQAEGYIAAQGPKKSTVVDMWTMVWQTDANRIVMVTKSCEGGKVKCEQYWPDQGMVEFGKFKVSLVDSQKFADYTIRILSLVLEKSEPRPVYHFHFTGWPDRGVPEEATALLDFRRKIRSHDEFAKGPLIVHCSAGVGRTGTFLAVDYLLEQAKAEGIVDVLKYTCLMRSNRMNMIQTTVQYEFVYQALLEAHRIGETQIPAHEMEARYSELKSVGKGSGKLEEQFMLLQKLKIPRTATGKDSASETVNTNKNRDGNIVALDGFRVHLSSPVDGTNDYVNAIGVDGYLERQAYIATQLPLPHTVVDLWRLMYDRECSCIVMLEQLDIGDESTPQYWPAEKDKPLVMAQLTVSLLSEQDLEEGVMKMMEFEMKIDKKTPRTVRLYQFFEWPPGTDTPTSLEGTLQLLDHIQRWQLRSGYGALCFQCKYGYERTGLMIAACYLLEKLKVDREVDVFHAVKQIRTPRPELVTSLTQYEFLHELAIAYINSCADYANFK